MDNETLILRPPSEVMRLERLGSFHPTRLSFTRNLLRRMKQQNWRIEIKEWKIDESGYGYAIITAATPSRIYSLVAVAQEIKDTERSDRVIAEKWDATFGLFDGVPDDSQIKTMIATIPKQEAARQMPQQLTLSRANKSTRIFTDVVSALANGQQPDPKIINDIGYIMRTTAVYGNGKFGIADRQNIAGRDEMKSPFQVEMLTVYMIRHFSIALINHLAKQKGGAKAVPLDEKYARHIGIGNATGLGMAPFIVRHQALFSKWIEVREKAIAEITQIESITPEKQKEIMGLIKRARQYIGQWQVDDERQSARIAVLGHELEELESYFEGIIGGRPLAQIFNYARKKMSFEAQEMLVSIMLEPFGDKIDNLAESMDFKEKNTIDPTVTIGMIKAAIEKNYDWCKRFDLAKKEENTLFWYVSETKLEPRLGRRFEESGAEAEMPFDIPHQIRKLSKECEGIDSDMPLAEFLLDKPQYRYICKRIAESCHAPYGEIRDNLVAETTKPIDMLRCKLSFFGAGKFDPKSILWTRINLFQGAPLAHQLNDDLGDGELLYPIL